MDEVEDAGDVEDVKDVDVEGVLPISGGTVWESSVAKPIIPITMTMTITAAMVVPIAALWGFMVLLLRLWLFH